MQSFSTFNIPIPGHSEETLKSVFWPEVFHSWAAAHQSSVHLTVSLPKSSHSGESFQQALFSPSLGQRQLLCEFLQLQVCFLRYHSKQERHHNYIEQRQVRLPIESIFPIPI